jgi:ABC-2 type transport system ATP-binding protein
MQEEFYSLLEESRNSGSTVFISSHNLSEVERICHRMAIIRKGEIKRIDSIEELRKVLKKRLKFTLLQPAGDFILPGAELINQEGLTYEYLIHDHICELLKSLSELPLSEVTIPEPALEEIFINFYKDDADD